MGDLEGLLLVLAVIYLSECIVWVPRGALLLARWWGTNFRVRHPGLLAGNRHGSLYLANPFPPFGRTFLVHPVPLSVSPDGILAYSAVCLNPVGRPEQSGRFLRFDQISSISAAGRRVLVNGSGEHPAGGGQSGGSVQPGALFLKAPSSFSARSLAHWLRRLARSPRDRRAAEIRKTLDQRLNHEKVAAGLAEIKARSKWIRALAIGLWAYLFGLAPVILWQYGWRYFGWPLLAGLLAQTGAIAFLFRRAHRALYPEAEEERFKAFLTLLLAPPAAIRAPDLLARHLLADADPLAAAKVLCPAHRFQRFARQVVLDLRYPLLPVCPTTNHQAIDTERWFRTQMLEAVQGFLKRQGLAEPAPPPRPAEPGNQSYCPRCQAQFVVREGHCRDCGGRPLVTFT